MKIFITGATGFLGKRLVRELSPSFETIYILSRNSNNSSFADFSNVHIIKGDMTNLKIFDNKADKDLIANECDFVIHAAALYDLTASYQDCYMQNIVGTQNIIRLVKKMKKLISFYYISTIAVGDDQNFFLEENCLPVKKVFNDYYSETKYFAEKLVRDSLAETSTRIIRPGIIVGDSKTGNIEKIDGPYYFIRAMKKYKSILNLFPLLVMSFNPTTKLPLIPIDHCTHFISLLILRDNGEKRIKTYHLVSNELPTTKDFLEDLGAELNLKTKFISVRENSFHNALLKLLGIPKELVPFMFSKLSYDKTSTIEDLPEIKSSVYNDYKKSLFK